MTMPYARDELRADLTGLGMSRGDVVLVHSSLRRVGPVAGGAASVVQSLLEVLGPSGTLVVPTFTANNSDPKHWVLTCRHPAPPTLWPFIRDYMPAFDRTLTPSFNVGALAEVVRTWPTAVRSDHPQTSFAAVGVAAETLMACHPLDCHLGPNTPLGALHQANAKVLLLGVSYAACTAFHLGEYQIDTSPQCEYDCVVRIDGERRWHHYRDVRLDDSDFERLGEAFETSEAGSRICRGKVGDADSRLFSIPEAATFAGTWMRENRNL